MAELNFGIEIDPDIDAIRADINRDIEKVTAEIFGTLAEDAPDEMRGLMSVQGGRSERGEAPHQQSGYLARSLKGTLISPTEAEIEMAEYGEHLDPELGGNLDRPFFGEGVNRSLAKSLDSFR